MGTLIEIVGSRERRVGSDPGVDLDFIYAAADSTETEDTVAIAVETTIPQTYLFLSMIAGIIPVYLRDYTIKHEGNLCFKVTAHYGKNEVQKIYDQPGGSGSLPGQASTSTFESEFTFDTTGGTVNMKQSLETVEAIAIDPVTGAVEDAYLEDYEGAIGVDGDSVQGVDITIPQFAFTETHHFHPAWITPQYVERLELLTGSVNNAEWVSTRGFRAKAGECLFLGSSGQVRGAQPVAVSFKFVKSRNVKNLAVGSKIIIPEKKGHEYLWCRYMNIAGSRSRIKKVAQANVERVYRETNFEYLLPWR